MKIHRPSVLGIRLRAGARAAARFNIQNLEARDTASPLDLWALKRRERRAPGEGGSITFIFIALLAIMMILVTAETTALHHLHREVKFLEQQQIKRLVGATTNAPAAPAALTK